MAVKYRKGKSPNDDWFFYIDEKIVGILMKKTKVYHYQRSSRLFYVKGSGYPISNSILKDLFELGCTKVHLTEHTAKGDRYFTCPLEKYRKAVLIEESVYDQQRCVPLAQMDQVDFHGKVIGTPYVPPKRDSEKQVRLFK